MTAKRAKRGSNSAARPAGPGGRSTGSSASGKRAAERAPFLDLSAAELCLAEAMLALLRTSKLPEKAQRAIVRWVAESLGVASERGREQP